MMDKDKKKLHDILDAIEAIEAYSVPSYAEFHADAKTQDAILYNLIIIGEAANQISSEFREQNPMIPWSAMIGTKNIIYNLIIIGEAANHISGEYKEQNSTIPWSAMFGTRNIIVHGCDQVKLQIVWGILQGDLESLKSEITKALD